MDLNLILQGWLIKSPPENKSSGPFKLFKAKWRRRWFVLYEPLALKSLPGTRAALDYYNNDRRQKKLGSIDLDHCEEVQFKLDSADYKHIFSLRTKHKGNDRTYFLSVASEAEMMKWVDCLCLALGLKENPEEIEPSQMPLNPQAALPQLLPHSTHPSGVTSTPQPVAETLSEITSTVTHSQHPSTGYNSHTPQNNHKTLRDADIEQIYHKSEAYIPLTDCYTGERDATHLKYSDRDANYRGSNDSLPPEPPPSPPVKTGYKLSEVLPAGDPSLYDSPTKSYINLVVDDNENVYKIPRVEGEGVYKMPRGSTPDGRSMPKIGHGGGHQEDSSDDQEGVYKVPHGDWVDAHKLSSVRGEISDSDDGIYKIPRSDPMTDQHLYKTPPRHTTHHQRHAGTPDVNPIQQDVSVFSRVLLSYASDVRTSSAVSPRSSPDGEAAKSEHENAMTYKVPPLEAVQNHVADLYDIPKNMSLPRNSSIKTAAVASLYDTPKACLKMSSENSLLESVVPAPAQSQPSLRSNMPFRDSRYENLQQNVFSDTTIPRMSQRSHASEIVQRSRSSSAQYYNQQLMFEDTSNALPPSIHSSEKDAMAQSPLLPPKAHQPGSLHSYINTPSQYSDECHRTSNLVDDDGFYMPMSPGILASDSSVFSPHVNPTPLIEDTMGGEYTDMRSAHSQLYSVPSSNRPVNPSVHDVVPPPSKKKETYVFQTHRTRSFKRPVQANQSDVVLPTRRTGISDDVSSSDEDSSSSSSQHDKSADSISYRNYPPPYSKGLTAKMGALNCTPPAPKRQGEIQYLDLALDKQSDEKKSSLHPRSPASGNVSPTNYKEIDFVKTKALNETQKDVESKRKSSERSADE